MRIFLYTLCFLSMLFVTASCSKTSVYEEKTRSLDSLSGVINSALKELEKGVDTITLEKSVMRFSYYKDFIRQNVNDTLTKVDAENLRHFYAGGKNLLNFSESRKLILRRASVLNEQLVKLKKDIVEKNIDADHLLKYASREKQEAAKLMELVYAQQKLFHASLEEFMNSLPGVESLIRSRNNGELPRIIKDTVSL
jgi:hypothetical protein